MKYSIYITTVLLMATSSLFAQEDDYIVKNEKDTIYCSSVTYERKQYTVREITYYDKDGNMSIVNKKNNFGNITLFRQDGNIYELINLDGIVRGVKETFFWRKINGKVILYDFYKEHNDVTSGRDSHMAGPTIYMVYVVKLPDGRFIQLIAKNIKKIIMPYMEECEAFKNTYKGYSSDKTDLFTQKVEFENMLKLYNSVCD